MNSSSLKAILAGTATVLSLSVMAADPTVDPTNSRTELTPQQQGKRDLKTESKAEYKARKEIAEVNKDLDVADCKTAGLDSKDVRDCKRDAKENAKAAKQEAKEIYKNDKANIKAQTE
ncbi:MAG: hypothetical protein Q7V20_03030 [Aquabacterium sp.]|uniref:hypothetical protein n=1 Tax=Aquabacterium sp. TaxID=1872578 RepID=UPI0027268B3D|nr:hypothetical protein [Aquabacterium sp.]MDO9002413.1 hypothetical protein [Aquabacterium sp.]